MQKINSGAAILLCAFVVLAFGCGDDSGSGDGEKREFNGSEIVLKESEELTVTAEELSGTGSVVFSEPLGAVDEGASFRLTFTLEDEGGLGLLSFADSDQLGGLTISFVREGDEVEVTLTKDATIVDAGHLEGVDATGTIDLVVDVHNNETPAHVLVWNAADVTAADLEAAALLNTAHSHEDHAHHDDEEHDEEHDHDEDDHDEDDHDEDEHDEDDHDEEEATSPGNGTGNLWGLNLAKATVTSASAGDPIFEE